MADSSLIFTDLNGVVVSDPSGGNDILAGVVGPNTFYFAGTSTGKDTIQSFGHNDILVVDQKIFDGNKDGIIQYGGNKILDLDGPDSGVDTVTFTVPGPAKLRYLGHDADNHFVYADASVRPAGAKEGTLGNDVLTGTKNVVDKFFFDTDLDANLGKDKIACFGKEDFLVTTSAIYDSNHDGKISFGGNKLLELPGSDNFANHTGEAPGHVGAFGQVSINDGKVQNIYLDHTEAAGDVTYYYYGLTPPHDVLA